MQLTVYEGDFSQCFIQENFVPGGRTIYTEWAGIMVIVVFYARSDKCDYPFCTVLPPPPTQVLQLYSKVKAGYPGLSSLSSLYFIIVVDTASTWYLNYVKNQNIFSL